MMIMEKVILKSKTKLLQKLFPENISIFRVKVWIATAFVDRPADVQREN